MVMQPPEHPAWPSEVPPIEDLNNVTLDQKAAASRIISELMTIPGQTGECSLRLKYQRKDFLSWGEKVQKVEQTRCAMQVEAAAYEAEGIPWWGLGLGIAGGATLGLVLGIVFGLVGAQ